MENGTFTFIGATTENPSFEVISPLLSRCRVFTLEQLSEGDVAAIVRRALADPERGLGRMAVEIAEERRRHAGERGQRRRQGGIERGGDGRPRHGPPTGTGYAAWT